MLLGTDSLFPGLDCAAQFSSGLLAAAHRQWRWRIERTTTQTGFTEASRAEHSEL